MRLTYLATALVALAASSAWAQDDPERRALASVRLSTEPSAAAGCTRVGTVSDDSLKDLRRKILRAGGNTGVLSFSATDLEKVYAEVFRCTAPPPATAAPPCVPPPPRGTPPPPPAPPPTR